MTDSERYTADVAEALLRAACDATDGAVPQAAAAKAMRWLRKDCDRGRGIRPGWGGQDTHLLADPADALVTRRRIVELKQDGKHTIAEIGREVDRSPRTVLRILQEAKLVTS